MAMLHNIQAIAFDREACINKAFVHCFKLDVYWMKVDVLLTIGANVIVAKVKRPLPMRMRGCLRCTVKRNSQYFPGIT
jgi:hypothetical protein